MDIMRRRMSLVLMMLGILSSLLIGQLLSFQFRLNPSIESFAASADERGIVTERITPNRGQIYDRDGVVLAVNSFEYRVGISPALIIDRREAATQLAPLLNLDEAELYESFQPDVNGAYTPYILLAGPIDEATATAVEDLELGGVQIEAIPLRSYPQGNLMSQILGFVNEGGAYYGIEAQYDRVLAGTAREIETDGNILTAAEVPQARDGQSLVLTIDRDVQFIVQDVLAQAVQEQGAEGGTIIVMNPRTGEILGMQSWPLFEPGAFAGVDPETGEEIQFNPAISSLFEPGSIIKVVSASIALQANMPGLDLNWTYYNQGCEIMAGVTVCDSDRVAQGNVDFRRCLVQSLNTCTAHWYALLGHTRVYPTLQDFGFGRPTGIDMEGEAAGIVNLPGSPNWSEADFLNVSYGQGIAATPLQMITAVNAIANDGIMMQPHIVRARYDGNRVYTTNVNPIARPISPEVADAVTSMMVDAVYTELGFGELAQVEGYTIAGKTGTAQKPTPVGYSATDSWASFIGFLPADDPVLTVLVVLDNPDGYWGSLTSAPVFQELVSRLVVVLEIPPDSVRLQLESNGGAPFARD